MPSGDKVRNDIFFPRVPTLSVGKPIDDIRSHAMKFIVSITNKPIFWVGSWVGSQNLAALVFRFGRLPFLGLWEAGEMSGGPVDCGFGRQVKCLEDRLAVRILRWGRDSRKWLLSLSQEDIFTICGRNKKKWRLFFFLLYH